MTDTAPSLVSILSAQVTLTGTTLAPGNVSIFSGSATVDLMRLQTDVAYLATAANIPAGNYTAVTLTFANPSLTIENDTGERNRILRQRNDLYDASDSNGKSVHDHSLDGVLDCRQ